MTNPKSATYQRLKGLKVHRSNQCEKIKTPRYRMIYSHRKRHLRNKESILSTGRDNQCLKKPRRLFLLPQHLVYN